MKGNYKNNKTYLYGRYSVYYKTLEEFLEQTTDDEERKFSDVAEKIFARLVPTIEGIIDLWDQETKGIFDVSQ